MATAANPFLSRLGFAAGDRVAILHADDVGMCPATVPAFAELIAAGSLSSGSLMVPCPAFPQAAALCRSQPEMDLGVHLTLNSEWETYRWGPLSPAGPRSGLRDAEGFFPREREAVGEADPEAPLPRSPPSWRPSSTPRWRRGSTPPTSTRTCSPPSSRASSPPISPSPANAGCRPSSGAPVPAQPALAEGNANRSGDRGVGGGGIPGGRSRRLPAPGRLGAVDERRSGRLAGERAGRRRRRSSTPSRPGSPTS